MGSDLDKHSGGWPNNFGSFMKESRDNASVYNSKDLKFKTDKS